MQNLPLIPARVGLALVALYALLRVIDPEARWAAGVVRADRVEHAVVVYAMVTLALAAFPRLRAMIPVLGMLAVGVGVELLQGLPGAPGDPQVGDLVADAVGVFAAVLPFTVGRWRGTTAV